MSILGFFENIKIFSQKDLYFLLYFNFWRKYTI